MIRRFYLDVLDWRDRNWRAITGITAVTVLYIIGQLAAPPFAAHDAPPASVAPAVVPASPPSPRVEAGTTQPNGETP